MSWIDALPPLRGRLLRNEPLAPFTWLRVGGPAEALFLPADVDDLATALAGTPPEVPVTILGVGSNLIVRDGGIEGLVVRLAGRAFGGVEVVGSNYLRAGAAALDAALARAAAAGAIGGLEFYAGVPGSIGGALAMNAGCYGAETSDVLVEALGLDRQGRRHDFPVEAFAFAYRTARAPADMIWISATFRGRGEPREAIEARICRDHRPSRGKPARSRENRRLDVQEPARPLSLAPARRGRVARPRARGRDVLPSARQFPHQHRRREGFRSRGARRGGARRRPRAIRCPAGMGDPPAREAVAGRGELVQGGGGSGRMRGDRRRWPLP